MSRPRSESGGPAAAASNRRRRALTYDDLPKEIKGVIKDYLRHTNESLRAAVKEYFEDKATFRSSVPALTRGLVLEVFLDRCAQGRVLSLIHI